MRLAMVVTGGLHPSGREQVVPSLLALFERLARTHDVHAFSLRHLPQLCTYHLRGFTVHDLGRPWAPLGLTRWMQDRALRRALAAAGPFDLIHGFWADPAGLLAARVGRHFRIPSVVTCDSGEFVNMPKIAYGSQRTARGRAAVRDACRLSDRVHVCTEFMREQAARHGVDATVIPIGAVAGPDAASRPSGTAVLRLLQVASLSPVKNQEALVDAVAILARDIDVQLDLVGEDTLGGRLQTRARDSGVADRVVFHGFVPNDQLGRLFASADLYVQSSTHEAASVSVLEAAVAGLPIVGTQVGYIADWAPGRAEAVETATPHALAVAIRKMQANRERAHAMATAAGAWARNHDADWTAAQFNQLYRGLAGRR